MDAIAVWLFQWWHIIATIGFALAIWGIATDGRASRVVKSKRFLLIVVLLLLTLPIRADDGGAIMSEPCDVCFQGWPWWVCYLRGCCWPGDIFGC